MKKLMIFVLALLLGARLDASDRVFVDAANFPVFGKATSETITRYERLPSAYETVSREALWWLGRHSAGLYIRFRSNSTSISAKWTSTFNFWMNHMTPTGTKGLDLYVYDNGHWRFAGSARPGKEAESESLIIGNMDAVDREYMLYLSLYDGVSALEIGIDSDAVISQPQINNPRAENPVVMYGTSILQGGCANRPGMAHTSIIERRIDRQVINLGFSGNALLDMEIADLMASVPEPSLYVLDYVPNASARMIDEHGEEFFRRLRNAHPDVPVIFIEDPTFPTCFLDNAIYKEVTSKNESQLALFKRLKTQGEKNIYYIPTDKLLLPDGESTVDGCHFTDLGMTHFADVLMPVIEKALKKYGKR